MYLENESINVLFLIRKRRKRKKRKEQDKFTRSYLHIFSFSLPYVKDQYYFLGEQTRQSIVQVQKRVKEMVPKQGKKNPFFPIKSLFFRLF